MEEHTKLIGKTVEMVVEGTHHVTIYFTDGSAVEIRAHTSGVGRISVREEG